MAPEHSCQNPLTLRIDVRLTGESYRNSYTMKYWDDQPSVI